MDATTQAIVSITALALSVAGTVLGVINHKRVRSTCCGSKGELSLDIDSTTPPQKFTLNTLKTHFQESSI